jgi:hypothetical protein
MDVGTFSVSFVNVRKVIDVTRNREKNTGFVHLEQYSINMKET